MRRAHTGPPPVPLLRLLCLQGLPAFPRSRPVFPQDLPAFPAPACVSAVLRVFAEPVCVSAGPACV